MTSDGRVAQFTAGPWFVADGGVCAKEMPADGGNVICCEPERVMAASLAKWPENARLIAAAPDLYEALRNIVAGLGATEENDGSKPLWRAAFDALAKASDPS